MERREKMQHNLDLHGGNIYKAAKQYGIHPDQILDFSANINPLGVPESVKRTIVSNLDNLANYPDPECSELKTGISEYLKIPEEYIIVGNGASEIISLVFSVLDFKNVLIPGPTFAEYPKAADSCGVRVVSFEMKETEGFNLNVDQLIQSMTKDIDAIFLCNPNNPTSNLISREKLKVIIEAAKERNVFVVLDEAFIELTAEGNTNSMIDLVPSYPNLFVIRAFTKVFAIPGLRLGYGVGNTEVIRRLWIRKMPWSVSLLACSLGSLFQKERAYLNRTTEWIREEKKWLYEELSGIKELRPFEPHANFILIKILSMDMTAGALKDKMAQKGILIRDASNFIFLNRQYFRVAIKDRASNKKLVNTLRAVLEGMHG
ncbi:MAG: threonine-phosphate decarboxylase CobD [Clostridia bacterium]|nr:threonine-phosphate decarboxylase CobD [Clostridia bacterium]